MFSVLGSKANRTFYLKVITKLISVLVNSTKILFTAFLISKYRLSRAKYGLSRNNGIVHMTRHNYIIDEVLLEIANDIECDKFSVYLFGTLFSCDTSGRDITTTATSDFILGDNSGNLIKISRLYARTSKKHVSSHDYIAKEPHVLERVKKTVTFDDNIVIYFIPSNSYGGLCHDYINNSTDLNNPKQDVNI